MKAMGFYKHQKQIGGREGRTLKGRSSKTYQHESNVVGNDTIWR